jgi:hypothetical protein
MRNALATVPKVAQQMVAATLRTAFAQPYQASAHETIERLCRLFEKRYPHLAKVVQTARSERNRGWPRIGSAATCASAVASSLVKRVDLDQHEIGISSDR